MSSFLLFCLSCEWRVVCSTDRILWEGIEGLGVSAVRCPSCDSCTDGLEGPDPHSLPAKRAAFSFQKLPKQQVGA